MAGPDIAAARAKLRRSWLGLVFMQVVFGIGVAASWLVVGLVGPAVAALVVALGIGVFSIDVRRRLAPVAALHGETTTDAQVLEAHALMRDMARVSGRRFALTWGGAQLVFLVLAIVDVPVVVVEGDAERLAGAMFVCSAPGLAYLTELLFGGVFAPVRAQVALEVHRRRLSLTSLARERSVSFIRPFVGTAAWLLIGAALAIGGGAIVWNAQVEREHAEALTRERVAHALTRARVGGEALDGVEVVSVDALPPELRRALDEPGAPEVVALSDIERNHVFAAARIEGGRALVSEVEPGQRVEVIAGILLVIALLAGPLFGVAFAFFGRALTRPLEALSAAARQFADAGEVDELERIVAVSDDEFGELAASFHAMFEVLAELTRAAAAISAGDLSVEVEHPGELHTAFRGMLARLNEIVGRLRDTVFELASAAAEIDASIEGQEQAAMVQANSVQEVAATVTSLARSAQQIAAAAIEVRVDAERAVATTQIGAERIASLRQHTAQIGELLVQIGDIAGRSDLLALNGSLEATRAGEAGRGFALVAAEMRRLAERVSGTVDDVRSQVANVEAASAESVAVTRDSRALAERTAQAARTIDELTANQSADTEHAAHGISSTADMVAATTQAMSKIRAATAGMHAHALELERLLAGFELREGGGPRS